MMLFVFWNTKIILTMPFIIATLLCLELEGRCTDLSLRPTQRTHKRGIAFKTEKQERA